MEEINSKFELNNTKIIDEIAKINQKTEYILFKINEINEKTSKQLIEIEQSINKKKNNSLIN